MNDQEKMMPANPPIPSEQDPLADRKRWTADDCEKLEGADILQPGAYELLNGVIVERRRNLGHSVGCKKVFFALIGVFGVEYVLLPVALPVDETSHPEPDGLVTKRPTRDYLREYPVRGNPPPSEMRLIVEVSDTTLWRDKNTKAKLYGGAGVPDYWVLDVNNSRLFVYWQSNAGGYAAPLEYDETQSVVPLAASTNLISVADLLP